MKQECSCLMSNTKTLKSLDLSTNCPKRQAGTPCDYCYVEAGRRRGFHSKEVIDYVSYKGEILRLKKPTIARLNRMGGLRLFSFGDYIQGLMDADLIRIIRDAQQVGLKLKAITKQIDFVERYAEAMNVCHISIDNVSQSPVSWAEAKRLKETYPSVRIRGVVMFDEDIEPIFDTCDIVVFNHAQNTRYKMYKYNERKHYAAVYPGKVCCTTDTCDTCPIKCGATD